MTVLHLLGSPRHGGAETYFLDLLEALHDGGPTQAAAIHANADREAALKAMGVRVDVLPFHPPFDLSTGPMIRRLAKELDAGVLVQWMNRAGRVVPRKGPWVRIGRLGGYYHLKYYRGADFLVGNTRDIVDYIVREGWPAERVAYIPNFAVAKDEPPVNRADHDTPADAPLLLGMGRLHRDKAHDVSLQALAALPGAYLWIAGAGPLEAQLRAQAARLGVADRVRVPGLAAGRLGPVPRRRHLPVPLAVRAAGQHGDPGLGPRHAADRRRQPGARRPGAQWRGRPVGAGGQRRRPWPPRCAGCWPTRRRRGAWPRPGASVSPPSSPATG